MAQLKDLIVTGDSRVIGNNYTNNPKIAFGTCSTAAGTAEKVVVVDDPTWNLQVGDIVGVKFTNSNTAGTVKLNVNNSGAIQVSYNTSRPYTGSDQMITGYANRTILYQYDGTYWHWVFDTVNRNDNTYTTAKSWTAAGTAAKTATCHDYVAAANSWNIVQMVYANTSASALTLNINSQGAKSIYINGSASSSTNYTLPAGHYLVFYDGTNYYFRTDGKLTASITGDAATVNGKTVGVNVPSDAVFTDTKNTAGSTDSSSKLFLVGATSQAANPQTYSQDTAYVDTNGHLYSNSKQVVNLSDSQALTNKTYNGYTLAGACAKVVDSSISAGSTSTNLPTSQAVAGFVEGKGYTTNTGTITGISINNTSIATSGVANIVTNTAYNSSTNKIATMSDVPSFTFTDVIVNPW